MKSFPDGIDQRVGIGGITLSGGQRQRLALARAVAGADPDSVFLFDNISANLDARTERGLWDRLDEEFPDATFICITHKVQNIRRVDQVIEL